MQGKIFGDSVSLTQDKARVLYQYYRRAAEKIITQEVELEKKIAVCEEEKTAISGSKKKKAIRNLLITGIGGALAVAGIFTIRSTPILLISGSIVLVVGLILHLTSDSRDKKLIIGKDEQITTFRQAHKDIRRDYRVSKLGVVYVPFATQIPFEGKSILIDHTGSVTDKKFSLSAVRSPVELSESIEHIEGLMESIPVVESAESVEPVDTSEYSTSIQNVPMYDYLGGLDREIRNISYRLKDVDRISVSLPIVEPGSDESSFIEAHSTHESGDKPVVRVFDTQASDPMIQAFNALNTMKKGHAGRAGAYEDYFKTLMMNVAQVAQVLAASKLQSGNKVMEYANAAFSNTMRASFNHYSPVLEAEEITRIKAASFDYQDEIDDYHPFALKQSSRVKFDLFSKNWIAEDGSRTSMPFGIHQIQEEVLSPLIQNLMEETRIERLKIYNQIKDQKIDYLNQWHRDTEDFYGRNRSESNELINRMRDALAEYMASLNTFKSLQKTSEQMEKDRNLQNSTVEAEDKSAEALAAFEMQADEFRNQQEQFVAYMERLKEDIDRRATEFGYIEFYEASLRDSETRKIAQSSELAQSLDSRRKALLSAGPFIAAFAKIPPLPGLEIKVFDDLSLNLVEEAQKRLSEIESLVNEATKPNDEKSAANGGESAKQDSEAENSPESPVDEGTNEAVGDDDTKDSDNVEDVPGADVTDEDESQEDDEEEDVDPEDSDDDESSEDDEENDEDDVDPKDSDEENH